MQKVFNITTIHDPIIELNSSSPEHRSSGVKGRAGQCGSFLVSCRPPLSTACSLCSLKAAAVRGQGEHPLLPIPTVCVWRPCYVSVSAAPSSPACLDYPATSVPPIAQSGTFFELGAAIVCHYWKPPLLCPLC